MEVLRNFGEGSSNVSNGFEQDFAVLKLNFADEKHVLLMLGSNVPACFWPIEFPAAHPFRTWPLDGGLTRDVGDWISRRSKVEWPDPSLSAVGNLPVLEFRRKDPFRDSRFWTLVNSACSSLVARSVVLMSRPEICRAYTSALALPMIAPLYIIS